MLSKARGLNVVKFCGSAVCKNTLEQEPGLLYRTNTELSTVLQQDVPSGVFLLLEPAVDAGEEDGLPFVCRPHLPGVVDHPLFVTARAAAVDHRTLQLRVLLFLQSHTALLLGVEGDGGTDLLTREL